MVEVRTGGVAVIYLHLTTAALVGFAFGIGTCWILILRAKRPRRVLRARIRHPRVRGVSHAPDGDLVVTLTDGSQWRGSCTVWHECPSGERASTSLELFLSQIWTRERWEKGLH